MNATIISTRLLALVICILVDSKPAFNQEKERMVNLNGDWRFALGDNSKFSRPEYDDSDWETIYVPSDWQREGFKNYHGYAWYRRKFTIAYSDKDVLVLELGKVDDVDEVYINGHLIGRTGSFPPDYYTGYSYARKYTVPTEFLNKSGKNVIAVRVYDEGGEGGILGPQAGIFSQKNYSANSLNLFGKWKFRLDDDAKWSAEILDDTEWEDVIVPASWESQGFDHYDGFAWYRKSFKLPTNFSTNDLLIILGKIDDMDEVFINGKRIGGTGRIERRWSHDNDFQKYRTYTVPDGLLKPGRTNVIAVRVYDQEGIGGIYEGPITLLPQKEYKEFWRSYRSHGNRSTLSDWLSYYID